MIRIISRKMLLLLIATAFISFSIGSLSTKVYATLKSDCLTEYKFDWTRQISQRFQACIFSQQIQQGKQKDCQLLIADLMTLRYCFQKPAQKKIDEFIAWSKQHPNASGEDYAAWQKIILNTLWQELQSQWIDVKT